LGREVEVPKLGGGGRGEGRAGPRGWPRRESISVGRDRCRCGSQRRRVEQIGRAGVSVCSGAQSVAVGSVARESLGHDAVWGRIVMTGGGGLHWRS
jgi:hypothetical protein